MGYDKFEGLNQITDAYQKAVAKSLLINELGYKEGITGYELSHAKIGTSAWSFGGQQLDIGGNKDALALIKDIATHEQIDWTASLEVALKSNNSSLLSSTDKFKIDNALSSAYGKEKINESFISAINNYTSHIDKVEIELQKIKPDLKLSADEKLMLIDYQNQYLSNRTSYTYLEFSNSNIKIFKRIILMFILLIQFVFAEDSLITKKLPIESYKTQKFSLKEDETISYINKYNFDNLDCNVGYIFSDEELKTIGYVEIPNHDIYSRIKLPNNIFFQNRITHCAVFNGSIYVLEQVDTQRALALNQTLLYVCKIDKKIKKCKQVEIDSFSSYVEVDKNNFTINNNSIKIFGKLRKRDTFDNSDDKDFEISLKIF